VATISLAWNASTDNVGLAGYGVYLAGTLVGTTTSTTYTIPGLTCGTTYLLAVDAYDAAGNRSTRAQTSQPTSACSPPQSPTPTVLTGAHWGGSSDLTTFRSIGYDFGITTVNPNSPSSWQATLDSAQANGLKLIIGAYPEPYSYDSATGQWTVSAAGINFLNYLASRSDLVIAVFVYNEPYWISPLTGTSSSCGALSAAQLRGLRTKIQSIWPGAKIYHDIGRPSLWAPGGSLFNSYPCIGNKYADATGVADYVGIWEYPFKTSGYGKPQALNAVTQESNYVRNSMQAIPVWLNQAHACSGCGLVWPTHADLTDWNCAVRNALPEGSLISWYVWRQGIYQDYLANHPEEWSSTTAAACGTP
jgi:hypothetical protein